MPSLKKSRRERALKIFLRRRRVASSPFVLRCAIRSICTFKKAKAIIYYTAEAQQSKVFVQIPLVQLLHKS